MNLSRRHMLKLSAGAAATCIAGTGLDRNAAAAATARSR